MGAPARGSGWQPFEAGNTAAVRAGAWSPRKVDPLAAELVEAVTELRPDLAEARHAFSVWAWARAEAACLLYTAWFAEHPVITEEGDAPGVVAWDRAERRADALRQRLGLDPTSEAALRRLQAEATGAAIDLETLRDEGRRAREARALRSGGPPALDGPATAVVGG
jgi:hypothetical protein